MLQESHVNESIIEKLNKRMLLSVVDEIPNRIMSELDKKWVIRLMLYRKEWIFNWLEGSKQR